MNQRSRQRRHEMLTDASPLRRFFAVALAFIVAFTGIGVAEIAAAPSASAATTGVQVGSVQWPADSNIYANAVWTIGEANKALVIGTGGGTPTTPIRFRNTANTADRGFYVMGISVHPTKPGIYSFDGNAISGVGTTTEPAFTARYGINRKAVVEWSPANPADPNYGKTMEFDIPWPTGLNATSCGAEVNPLTYELVIARLLQTPKSFSQFARELQVSTSTVKSQASAIYSKLGVSGREEAVMILEEAGFYES